VVEEKEAGEAPAADSPCVPDAGGEPFCIYVVQDGDTLWGIAEALDLEGTAAFSAAELIALSNGLNDAQNWLIGVGQELRVPNASGVIHTVEESETISVLAELYGITAPDLIRANNITDANSVAVGQTLLIPSPILWPLSGPEAAEAAADGEFPPDAAAAEGDDPATEATAEAAPAAVPSPASVNANPSVSDVRDAFAAGYIAGGGPAQYLEFILANVIACESGYNLRAFNPAGPFYGLMQFLPLTWANTGGGDWFDPWQQGHNTAVLLQASHPGTQWPFCWR
jgi:LysM repeat protein